jgi:WD40 repeat protein
MAAVPIYQQNRIRLWSLATRENIALLDEPEQTAPVAFSAGGNSLLTTGDRHARFYRLDTPERLDLPAHAAAVPGIAFSPDGRQLASVSKDRVVRVCDAMTGRILWQTNDLPGAGQCVGYSPDGRWLADGDFDTDRVEVRDARTGHLLLNLGTNGPGATWSAQFSPDGRYLATTGWQGTRVYGIERHETGRGDGDLEAKLIKSSSVEARRSLVFAPDGRSLALTTRKPNLLLWNLDSWPQPHIVAVRVPICVQTESFTPDGHLVAIDQSGRIVTLELPAGKEISSFQAMKPSDFISAVICLSPDGSRLAVTAESQRGVDIWDFKSGQRLYALPEEAGTVYWQAWSPDSRRLAIARDNGHIAIWNLDTVGQILTKLGLNP